MYNAGTTAGGGSVLAATGASVAQYAWLAVALLTIGFALLAVGKLLPRRTR